MSKIRIARRRLAATIACGALLAVAVSAAVGATPSGGTASNAGQLTIGMAKGDIDSLDPQRWYFAATWGLSNGLCTTILRYADKPGAAGVKVVPGLAQLPVVTNGGKTYTFKLRPAKFANGKTITGQDVKYTMERMLNPNVDPGSGQYFYGVVGAQAYAAGKAKTISGIVATANTVTFKLTAPDGSFPYKAALPMTCPVPVGTPKKPDGGAALMSKYASGPYVVKSYSPGRSMVWVANPNYNRALGDRGHVDQINFQIGVDPSQAALKIKAGDLDLYTGFFATADMIQLSNDPTYKSQVFISSRPAVMTVFLNNTVAPFNNAKVRRAVNFAIDRTEIQKAYGGILVAKPTDQILPPTVPAFRDYHAYPNHPNLAKAKALMAASGIKTPVSTTLRVRNDAAGFVEVANVFAANLAKIGIKVKVLGAPGNVDGAADANWKTKTPAGVVTFSMDFPDGQAFIDLLLDPRKPKFGGSYARFNDKSFFGAYNRVAKLSGAARARAYVNLDQAVMTKDAPWAPLLIPNRFDFVSKRVTGYVYSRALDAFNLNTLGVK